MRTLSSLLVLVAIAAAEAPKPTSVLGSDRFRVSRGNRLCAFSPSGKYLLVYSDESVLHLFDVETGARLRERKVPWLAHNTIAIDDMGMAVVLKNVGHEQSQLNRIDMMRHVDLERIELPVHCAYPLFSPNGRFLLIRDDPNVRIFDIVRGQIVLSHAYGMIHDQSENETQFSGDGRSLLISIVRKQQRYDTIHDCSTGNIVAHFEHSRDIRRSALDAMGKHLVAGGSQRTVIYELATKKVLHEWPTPAGFIAFGFNAKGNVLATDDNNKLLILDRVTGKQLAQVERYRQISPDGRFAQCGFRDGAHALYDLDTGKLLPQSSETTADYHLLHYSQDGRLFGLADGWMAWENGRCRRIGPQTENDYLSWDPLQSRPQRFHVFSPDFKQFAAWGDGKLSVFKTDNAKPLSSVELTRSIKPRPFVFHSISCFAPEGGLICDFGFPNHLAFLNSSGKVHKLVELHNIRKEPLFSRLPSPDGRFLVSENREEQRTPESTVIQVHDTVTGKLLFERTSQRFGRFAFNRDCSRLALLTLYEVEVLDTSSWKSYCRQRFPWAYPFCLSNDGRSLGVYSVTEETIYVHEVASGAVRFRVKGVQWESVAALALSPDGRTLAASRRNGTICLWDISKDFEQNGANGNQHWEELQSIDGKTSYRAVRSLVQKPAEAVALLKNRIQPATQPDKATVAAHIAKLDSASFEDRDHATNMLASLIDRIEPQLQSALAETRSEEMRERLSRLVALRYSASAEGLRLIRAVEVVEILALSGNPDAKLLLKTWSKGAAKALLTTESMAALRRLD